MKSYRFSVLSDVHIGKNHYRHPKRIPAAQSLALLRQTISRIAAEQPTLCGQLGDLIQDQQPVADHTEDSVNYALGLAAFSALKCPTVHVIGNHEQVSISRKELANYLARGAPYYSFEMGEWLGVVLFCHAPGRRDMRATEWAGGSRKSIPRCREPFSLAHISQ